MHRGRSTPAHRVTQMSKKELSELFSAVYHGKYDFDDFAQGDIAGTFSTFSLANGRLAYRATPKLKAYHNFLNLFLVDYLPVNTDVVFSYRRNFSAVDAVAKHVGNAHFFQADISDFFPSLDKVIIEQALSRNDDVPFVGATEFIPRASELLAPDGHLPVGFSSSPALSNACLLDFDNSLQAHCLRFDLDYSRYADDIILSSRSIEGVFNAADVVDTLLQDIFHGKLSLNSSKTKLTSKGGTIRILGLVITPAGYVTVDRETKSRIEVLLHYYSKDLPKFIEILSANSEDGTIDLPSAVEKFGGLLSYVNSVDKDYVQKQRRKFGAALVDSILHKTPKH